MTGMPYMNESDMDSAETIESDEGLRLLNGSRPFSSDQQQQQREQVNVANSTIMDYIYMFNFTVSRSPWRLFEIADQSFTPPFLRHRCQSMLTAQWTHRIPFLQSVSPAERAASLILRTLSEIEDQRSSKLSIIDFCSGGGGPTPVIEKLVNAKREARGQSPLPFLLTDLHPNIDAWMRLASKSDNLSFIPQPVDATNPPVSVISETSPASKPGSEFSSDSRVFRLFCLSFHHFDDDMARKVLRSTLETSDAFAIIELQDRDFFSLLIMFTDFFLLFLVTVFWFWHDWLQLAFTYLIPLIPPIMSFDGLISSLRTRKFEEIMKLIDESRGTGNAPSVVSSRMDGRRAKLKTAKREGWTFEGGKEMHTFPFGYMNYFVGRKMKRD